MKVFISEEALQRHARGNPVNKHTDYRAKLAPLQGTWVKVKSFRINEFFLKDGMPVPVGLIDGVDLEDLNTFEEFAQKHKGKLTEDELWKIENLLIRVGLHKAPERYPAPEKSSKHYVSIN